MEKQAEDHLSKADIDKCIAILQQLNVNSGLFVELSEQQRIDLMKAAGKLSRPTKDELNKRRKDTKKAAKRKQLERDRHARNKTGIRSAREATVFIAPKLLPELELYR